MVKNNNYKEIGNRSTTLANIYNEERNVLVKIALSLCMAAIEVVLILGSVFVAVALGVFINALVQFYITSTEYVNIHITSSIILKFLQ